MNFEENQEDNAETQETDYKVKEDGSFTLDEQEEISRLRDELDSEIKRKQVFLKMTEAVGVNVICYSVARWLVLVGGYSQAGFAFAFILLFQQVLNRDIFNDFNINYNGGWEMNGGEKILKILGVVASSIFMAYIAVGDVVTSHWITQETYKAIQNQVEVYNEAPKDEQSDILKSVILTLFVAVVVLGIYSRISKD